MQGLNLVTPRRKRTSIYTAAQRWRPVFPFVVISDSKWQADDTGVSWQRRSSDKWTHKGAGKRFSRFSMLIERIPRTPDYTLVKSVSFTNPPRPGQLAPWCKDGRVPNPSPIGAFKGDQMWDGDGNTPTLILTPTCSFISVRTLNEFKRT